MIHFKLLIFFLNIIYCFGNDGFCYSKEECDHFYSFATNKLNGNKYILYEVNNDRNFNLRRDTYIQMAQLVLDLGYNWTLVLPPFGNLPKWKLNKNKNLDWSNFFKIEILQEVISVIEFNTFLEHVTNELDLVIFLNKLKTSFHYDNNLIHDQASSSRLDRKLENKYEIIPKCKNNLFFEKNKRIHGYFYGYQKHLTAEQITCIDVNGDVSILKHILLNEFLNVSTLFIQNAELFAHQKEQEKKKHFWLIRRSMQLQDDLVHRANKFRRKYFDSDDEKDRTFISNDWNLEKLNLQKQSRLPIGGNYLCIHLKNSKNTRTVIHNEKIVEQILNALQKLNLTFVFMATNYDQHEWLEFKQDFKTYSSECLNCKYKLYTYQNKTNKLLDGQLELIEQWICAHARLFIGSEESQFTKRIQEDREILGFSSNSTFNVLCDNREYCTQNLYSRENYI